MAIFNDMISSLVKDQGDVTGAMEALKGAETPEAQLEASMNLMLANQKLTTMSKSFTQTVKATSDAQQQAIDKSH